MAIYLGINELKSIASVISEKTGYPFSDMPLSFLKRRLSIVFEKLRIKSITDFEAQMNQSDFVDSFLYLFPVENTEMFRDPGFWRALTHKVLPNLTNTTYPIYIPDASTGEELYSLLVLLHQSKNEFNTNVIFQHPSFQRIKELQSGILKDKNLELAESNYKRLEMNSNLGDVLCTKNGTIFIESTLLTPAKSQQGWFTNVQTTKSNFSLIFLRNSLLYINKTMHEKILLSMYQNLVPGGYMVIGIKEVMPPALTEKMEIVDSQEQIYKKPGILNGQLL